MSSSELDRFIQSVISDHGIATGIKPLSTHYDLVAYANIRGFSITLIEWGRHLAMDWLQSPDAELELLQRADPISEGLLGTADFGSNSQLSSQKGQINDLPQELEIRVLSDSERDASLEAFIEMVKGKSDLKEQVKFARDQSEVIELANSEGFPIDSLTLLRRWNKVSDFTKPTWFGWFDE